jgi:hypothetical protein
MTSSTTITSTTQMDPAADGVHWITLYFLADLRLDWISGPGFPLFDARTMPIRANTFGPPRSTTRRRASSAARHSGTSILQRDRQRLMTHRRQLRR